MTRVLFSIAGGEDLGMLEVQDAANVITEAIDPDARVIFGTVTDDNLKKGQVRVTVIATGFPETTGKGGQSVVAPRLGARVEEELPPLRIERKPEPPVRLREREKPETVQTPPMCRMPTITMAPCRASFRSIN
jgi:cell division protein FtsZ